jgi:uncharacterized protein YsxB (DUF464 family)
MEKMLALWTPEASALVLVATGATGAGDDAVCAAVCALTLSAVLNIKPAAIS